jgi:hypothetical protein
MIDAIAIPGRAGSILRARVFGVGFLVVQQAGETGKPVVDDIIAIR